jgi:hypothetical protein
MFFSFFLFSYPISYTIYVYICHWISDEGRRIRRDLCRIFVQLVVDDDVIEIWRGRGDSERILLPHRCPERIFIPRQRKKITGMDFSFPATEKRRSTGLFFSSSPTTKLSFFGWWQSSKESMSQTERDERA